MAQVYQQCLFQAQVMQLRGFLARADAIAAFQLVRETRTFPILKANCPRTQPVLPDNLAQRIDRF
jgi:hypothetical protein